MFIKDKNLSFETKIRTKTEISIELHKNFVHKCMEYLNFKIYIAKSENSILSQMVTFHLDVLGNQLHDVANFMPCFRSQ